MSEPQKKWEQFVKLMSEKGIPVPMFRKKGEASASFTLVVVSTFFVALSLIESLHTYLKIDVNNSLIWAGMCYSIYFFNKMPYLQDKQKNNDNIKE